MRKVSQETIDFQDKLLTVKMVNYLLVSAMEDFVNSGFMGINSDISDILQEDDNIQIEEETDNSIIMSLRDKDFRITIEKL